MPAQVSQTTSAAIDEVVGRLVTDICIVMGLVTPEQITDNLRRTALRQAAQRAGSELCAIVADAVEEAGREPDPGSIDGPPYERPTAANYYGVDPESGSRTADDVTTGDAPGQVPLP